MSIKQVKTISLILFVFIIGFFITWQISKTRTFQFFGGIVPRVETDEKVVALTFDDGPTKNTQVVIGILGELGVKATFFVTGAELELNPEEGRRIVNAGHELGNHSYSHTRMVFKSPSFIAKEIVETDKLIRQAGYKGEIHFRPPFGKKLVGLPYYLKNHNRKTIMWDIEPESYPEVAQSSDKIVDHVVANTKPGSIILLHVMYDSRKQSVESIEGVVTSLREKGYEFVTISELLDKQLIRD